MPGLTSSKTGLGNFLFLMIYWRAAPLFGLFYTPGDLYIIINYQLNNSIIFIAIPTSLI
jgi:hypothetical protein